MDIEYIGNKLIFVYFVADDNISVEPINILKYLVTEITVETNIELSTEALNGGSSSPEYRAGVEQIMTMFQFPYLEDIETISVQGAHTMYNANMTLEEVSVSFEDIVQLGKPGQLAQRRTDTIITAVYNIYLSASTDLSGLEDSVWSSIMTAATEAISDNNEAYITIGAVPSVTILIQDTWTPDDTDYYNPDEYIDYSDYDTEYNTDECSLETDDCDNNAKCIDTDTSYTCECNPGFDGDGITCIGKTKINYLCKC